MKINKYVLTVLLIVVLASLIKLLNIQLNIVDKDIKNKQSTMELALPGILSDLYDVMIFNKEIDKLTNNYEGTEEFHFTSRSTPTDSIQIILKNELDQVLSLNYPDLEYKLDGFVSNEYGCMIHRNHRPELPKIKNVLDAESHLCFCMILNNTLDIALTYENKEEVAIGNSGKLLRTSFLLILVIIGAFGYTVYTIGKQKKLSDLKRDFINNLTHEFKTPIFSISLAAKSLQKQETIRSSEKMNSYVDIIGSETKRLQTQVDKILQMALLDSGNLTLEKKQIDLHESIKNVADSFRMIVSERSGEIVLNLMAKNHEIVADETHLNNILYNLIDNAQKYSESSPKIEIITSDSDNNGIELVIKDHGIGIPKKVQKYIFDQFYRAQQGDVHTVKGFGLGLSYVKRIIEFHKGTISLKSEVGKGSEFKIFIPLAS